MKGISDNYIYYSVRDQGNELELQAAWTVTYNFNIF